MRPSDARRCEDTDMRRSHPGEAWKQKTPRAEKEKLFVFGARG